MKIYDYFIYSHVANIRAAVTVCFSCVIFEPIIGNMMRDKWMREQSRDPLQWASTMPQSMMILNMLFYHGYPLNIAS